jgi:hypothetical protein
MGLKVLFEVTYITLGVEVSELGRFYHGAVVM